MSRLSLDKAPEQKLQQETASSKEREQAPKPSNLAQNLLALQRTAGNQAVTHLLQRAQQTSSPGAPVSDVLRSPGQPLFAHGLTNRMQQSMEQSSAVQRHAPEEHPEAPERLITLAELAAKLRRERDERIGRESARGSVRFRLPTTKDVYDSQNVWSEDLKDSIEMALTRMEKEGRLRTKDTVSGIMEKVFPSSGGFNEKEYKKVVNMKDPRKVYQNMLDAETKIRKKDKRTLIRRMSRAIQLIRKSANDSENLERVFGLSESNLAAGIYGNAADALVKVIADIDNKVTIDYNLDDLEIDRGAISDFATNEIHFSIGVVKAKNSQKTIITIIHEACHLASPNVVDKGYYGTPGFEGMSVKDKVNNAAHYEEIPLRYQNKSQYGKRSVFKPERDIQGADLSFEQNVRRKASEYLRLAWDKAVRVFEFLRRLRIGLLKDDQNSLNIFNQDEKLILQISELMHLTIHLQIPPATTVNQIDIVLAEGVVRGIDKISKEVPKQSVPEPPKDMEAVDVKGKEETQDIGMGKVKDGARQVIANSIEAYDALTGTYAGDVKLLNWLRHKAPNLDQRIKKP